MIRVRVMGDLSLVAHNANPLEVKILCRTRESFWIGLPMQMMYGLVLGVIVGTMVSSEFGATSPAAALASCSFV